MAVIMRKHLGEEEVVCVEASSSLGDGNLHITNMAVAYEVNMAGLYLNFIPHKTIKSISPSGNVLFGARRFRIIWSEDGAVHSFEIRTRKHRQLQDVLGRLSLGG